MSWWDNLGSSYHQFYFITSIIVSIFSFYIAFATLARYLQRKNNIALILAIHILLLSIAIVLDPIFLFYRASKNLDYVVLQGILSFGLTGYANIFLIIFLRDIFYNKKINSIPLILATLEACILPIGLYMYQTMQDAVPLLGFHLLLSFIIYLTQFIKSLILQDRLKKEHPNDIVGRKGFLFIGLAGLFLFLTYVSFILQELQAFFGDTYNSLHLVQNGATIFIPIGFILSGISAIFLYLGFLMPEWIRKRWENKKI